MELLEYLTVRRAYNQVRHEADAKQRLTFPEFAILCRLSIAGGTLKTSEIAEYQGSLRPTMTHRTKHLDALGLIRRSKGEADRRNVVCELTDEGRGYVVENCSACCSHIKAGQPLSRIDAERMCRYVEAMGSISCRAAELVLMGVSVLDEGTSTITGLVELLGLLQPTVSMSVTALQKEGMVERRGMDDDDGPTYVVLTEAGEARLSVIAEQVHGIVVRRKQRAAE